jgi:choline dehydrogenase-like flavoprotein
MFIKADDIMSDVNRSCDVCVIGAGSGGSVMAWEMARAGLSVIVLEDGGYHRGADYNQREADMFGENYVARNARATKDMAVAVMQGRGVGGGSTINVCDCVRIHDEVLAHWAEKYGVVDMTPEIMRPYFEKVEALLSVKRITDAQINTNNSLIRKGSETLGYAGEKFNNNRVGCVGCGYCLIGCAYDAKQAGHTVYVPQAVEAGADVYTYARVESIAVKDGRAAAVTGAVMNRETNRPRAAITIEAKVVMLGANTINTPQILLNSKIANSSGQVGKNLSLQPQSAVFGVFDEPVKGYRGIPQAYAVTQFEEASRETGLSGFRIEGIFGSPGIAAAQLPGFGMFTKEMMTSYPSFTSVLVLVPDPPSGEVTVNKYGRPVITYTFADDYKRRLIAGIKEAAKIFFAAGAIKVMPAYTEPTVLEDVSQVDIIDKKGIEPASIALISAHQYGTCRMGEDPKTSVVNSYGKSHDVANLFIVDASTNPTSSSTHNMIPIMAMAHRTADHILKNRNDYFE